MLSLYFEVEAALIKQRGGKTANRIPLGYFATWDDANAFQEEIKYGVWTTKVIPRSLLTGNRLDV